MIATVTVGMILLAVADPRGSGPTPIVIVAAVVALLIVIWLGAHRAASRDRVEQPPANLEPAVIGPTTNRCDGCGCTTDLRGAMAARRVLLTARVVRDCPRCTAKRKSRGALATGVGIATTIGGVSPTAALGLLVGWASVVNLSALAAALAAPLDGRSASGLQLGIGPLVAAWGFWPRVEIRLLPLQARALLCVTAPPRQRAPVAYTVAAQLLAGALTTGAFVIGAWATKAPALTAASFAAGLCTIAVASGCQTWARRNREGRDTDGLLGQHARAVARSRSDEAERLMQQAIERKPDRDDLRVVLVHDLLALGRRPEARATLRAVLAKPGDPSAARAWAANALAWDLLLHGGEHDRSAALGTAESAYRSLPWEVGVADTLALAWIEVGDPEGGLDLAEAELRRERHRVSRGALEATAALACARLGWRAAGDSHARLARRLYPGSEVLPIAEEELAAIPAAGGDPATTLPLR